MKKILAIAVLAAILVSCNDSKTTEEVKTTDSITSTATEVAAAAAADTTIKTAIDTTKAPDSLKK